VVYLTLSRLYDEALPDSYGLHPKTYSVFYFNTNIKNQKENTKEYVLEGRKQKPKYGLEAFYWLVTNECLALSGPRYGVNISFGSRKSEPDKSSLTLRKRREGFLYFQFLKVISRIESMAETMTPP
jgi:hypothetical protein